MPSDKVSEKGVKLLDQDLAKVGEECSADGITIDIDTVAGPRAAATPATGNRAHQPIFPAHSGSLNLVERWFAELTTRKLRRSAQPVWIASPLSS